MPGYTGQKHHSNINKKSNNKYDKSKNNNKIIYSPNAL
jgi:hypothetical protein